MQGLAFIVPTLLFAYWVLSRFTGLRALQRGVALAVLAIFTEVVSATLWWPGSQAFIRELVWSLLIAYLVGMLGSIRESRREGQDTGLRGWGLAMVTLMFSAILLLNLGLIYVAEHGMPESVRQRLMPDQSTELAFPGLIAPRALPREEMLRPFLRSLRRLGQLGWQLTEQWRSGPTAGAPSELIIGITRQDGSPLTGALVRVEALSAIDAVLDRWQDLEEVEPGAYRAAMGFGKAGVWGLLLRIDYAGETLHLFSTVQVLAFPSGGGNGGKPSGLKKTIGNGG